MDRTFITFGAPDIGPAELDEVRDTLQSGWLGRGPKVSRFERDFAQVMGVAPEQVVAVNSCSSALHLALIAAGIGPGDEVITTPLTFCATVNSIIHAGATPVLADVDPHTQTLDPAAVEACITPRTRGIIPVHFSGLACEMEALGALAKQHGLAVIEDCAHALETRYRGQQAGCLGDFGCFSFYATKNITTGEGGMVIARDVQAAQRIRILSNHGLTADAWRRFSDEGHAHYAVVECGFKYNMMDLQAAIGLQQLRRLSAMWERRSVLWKRYQNALGDTPLVLPAEAEAGDRHAHHLYTVRLPGEGAGDGSARDALMAHLRADRIGTGVHYLSVAEFPYYQQRFKWDPGQWPNAQRIGRNTLSLPLMPRLSDEQQAWVVASVRRFFGVHPLPTMVGLA